ncbi:MAG: hypothetical protein JSV38_05415, partial [Desulfobacterales bacterium]
MEFNKSIFFTIAKYILIIFLFGITACQSGLFSYRGRIIEPERHLTLLTNGPHKGLWETFDLTLEYQYEQKAGQLHVSGAAQLSYHYQTSYEVLDHFYLMV